MLRKCLPALLLIPLALACESGGANPAAPAGAAAVSAGDASRDDAAVNDASTDDLRVAAMSPATTNPAVSSAAPGAAPVNAYVESIRADLSDGKASLINRVMRLTKDESAVFWPIYHDYEDELFALGDQRVQLLQRYFREQSAGSLDGAAAASITDEWFRIESARLELMRKYQQQIAKELSPLRGAQFTQIEHRVGTITDLMIASNIPLIQTSARR